jgi:hypothetical protein
MCNWHKFSDEQIPKELSFKPIVIKRTSGDKDVVYPFKDVYFVSWHLCDDPMVSYKESQSDIEYWISVDELVD